MRGLDGVRVVLVDDEPAEAVPVIRAFSRAGVPIAYFDGNPNVLPPSNKRLRGVRLAILDMDLGVGGSKENIASTLVKTVSCIVSPDNGPYGILIWTNHPDLRDLVTQYIFERSDLPKPVFVEMLKKATFVQKGGSTKGTKRFKMAKLSATLGALLADKSPLECLQVWEGLTFAAATNVTNNLAESQDSGATDLATWRRAWQDQTLKLLYVTSKAKAEKLHTERNCIASLFLALNPLLADRMEVLVDEQADKTLAGHAARIMATDGGTKTERTARVNSMLHLAIDDLQQLSAGNLYVFGERSRPVLVPTLREVLFDAVLGDASKKSENTKALLHTARLCGVEISPLCDHAQLNVRLSRLVLGVLVPHADKYSIKQAGFLKPLGPFYFAKSRRLAAGPYSLFLNARYMTAANPASLRQLRATVRLRPQLLTDVQSWAAYQGSRQGVMLLS